MAQPPQSSPDSKMAKDAAAKVNGGAKASAGAIASKVTGGTKAVRATKECADSIVPSIKK